MTGTGIFICIKDSISIEALDVAFSVCKVTDYSGVDIDQPFVFTGCTDEEKSQN